MKNGKAPTYKQKRLLKEHGLDPDEYLILKDTPGIMEAVTRVAVTKRQLSGAKPRVKTIHKN